MGYINEDLILSGLKLRLLRLKGEHESEEKITELENIIGAIEETETDDVVERSEFEKIKSTNKALQNRCKALTQGSLCLYCPIDCEQRVQIFRGDAGE